MKRTKEIQKRVKQARRVVVVDDKEKWADIAACALAPRTGADYKRDKLLIEQWTEESLDDLEEESFLELMLIMVDVGYSASRVEKMRSAVAHYLAMDSKNVNFTMTVGFRKKFNGVLSKCPEARCRGGITLSKLQTLLTHTEGVQAFGILLGYLALLRHSELVQLKWRDIEVAGEDAFITVIGPKGYKGKRGKAPKVFITRIPVGGKLINEWKEGTEPDEAVVKDWNKNDTNKLIQEVAKGKKWNPDLVWSFHSLRHGHAMDLADEGVDIAERKRYGRWKSAQSVNWYSRPEIK